MNIISLKQQEKSNFFFLLIFLYWHNLNSINSLIAIKRKHNKTDFNY
jgi:hypothetical protein